jgi:hypothetical protein
MSDWLLGCDDATLGNGRSKNLVGGGPLIARFLVVGVVNTGLSYAVYCGRLCWNTLIL